MLKTQNSSSAGKNIEYMLLHKSLSIIVKLQAECGANIFVEAKRGVEEWSVT